jgi:3-hydroxyacyl-CoA dehydrogenase
MAPQGPGRRSRQAYVPRSTLPVYGASSSRIVARRNPAQPEQSAKPCSRTTASACGALPAVDAGIGIISFKSKMHAIGDEVLDGVLAAVRRPSRSLDGLVIWHEAPFAVGANLQQISDACVAGDFDRSNRRSRFQQASMA